MSLPAQTVPPPSMAAADRAPVSTPVTPRLQDLLAPSRYWLPQHCSPDARRGREALLAVARTRFSFIEDELPGHPAAGFRLPPCQASLPATERFTAPKLTTLLSAKLQARMNALGALFLARKPPYRDPLQYVSLIRRLPWLPQGVDEWAAPGRWEQQRLTGVNPLELRLCREEPDQELAEAADAVLKQSQSSVREALAAGQLFVADYPIVGNDFVQNDAAKWGVQFLVPTCLFWANPRASLTAVAIRLRQVSPALRRVFTPLDAPALWNYARFHADVAHGAYHEGVRHLLETHLVCEAISICMHRQLSPDHPLFQLLHPHFQFTLAINELARRDLLSPGGPIDVAVSGGVGAALDAARVAWKSWDFRETIPPTELELRGFGPGSSALDGQYWYREDALRVWEATLQYVSGLVRLWYRSEEDLALDTELQAWAAELASDRAAGLRGFPPRFTNVQDLSTAVAAIVFRASAGHAAVNNGQYQTYGFIPTSPGTYAGPPLERVLLEAGITDEEVWAGLPDFKQATNQCSMVWVLSAPTMHDLFSAGESEAFSQALNPQAREVVATFRRNLVGLSDAIQRRNAGLAIPYSALDPAGIACSVET
jgi:arachidonate 15-lipoxygenase